MRRKKLAKMHAALIACQMLDEIGTHYLVSICMSHLSNIFTGEGYLIKFLRCHFIRYIHIITEEKISIIKKIVLI